jgi:hypothetical protein
VEIRGAASVTLAPAKSAKTGLPLANVRTVPARDTVAEADARDRTRVAKARQNKYTAACPPRVAVSDKHSCSYQARARETVVKA